MRKAFRILFGGLVLTSLVVLPLVVAGQVEEAQCCRLSQAITMKDFTYGCSAIVTAVTGATPGGSGNCDAGGENANCGFASGSVTMAKNTIIGGGDCLTTNTDACSIKGVAANLDIESAEWGTVCLLNSIYNVTNWIFYFFLAIAILIGVLAGFEFMTAAGDPGKVDKARSLLLYMVIGLVVAALAKVIPTLVRTVVGF